VGSRKLGSSLDMAQPSSIDTSHLILARVTGGGTHEA
jgi:hypothetical protein